MGSLIQGGMNSVAAYNQAESQKAVTAGQHVIGDANTYAANTVGQANVDAANQLGLAKVASTNATRLAQNAIVAANASAANNQRSIGNMQRVTAVGAKADTLTTNMVRSAQAMVAGSIDSRIRASEQLGALTAQASAAGIGGGSVGAVRSALNIQDSRQRAATDDKNKDSTYDGLVQRAGLQNQALQSLDLNQTLANINYAQDVYTNQIFTPGIAPIVPGDFAPDSGTAAENAFFGGTDWNKSISQGIDLFNTKAPTAPSVNTSSGFEAESYGYGGTSSGTSDTSGGFESGSYGYSGTSSTTSSGLFGASTQ